MPVIPDQASQEDLFALLVLKSGQLTFKEKQLMLSDLATVKARRLQDERCQIMNPAMHQRQPGEQSEHQQ